MKKTLLAVLLLTLLVAGCSAARLSSESPEMAPAPAVEMAAREQAPSGGESFASDQSLANSPQASVERLVIMNASLSIAVDDPEASMEHVKQLASDLGGYVVSINMYQYALEGGVKVPQVNMTIRVPAERLDEALTTIKKETTQPILSENLSSQDVTAEYVDLQSRLENLQAAETQLQQIMEDANRTEDVLAVYAQLTSVREQIELIQGQMQYYRQSADLSAISVDLVPNQAVQPLTIGGWQPAGVAKDALQALIDAGKFLANAGIWIVIFVLPVAVIVLGIPALIGRAILRSRKKAREAARQSAE